MGGGRTPWATGHPVDPTREQLGALRAGPEERTGPIQVLNLLAFRDAGREGSAAYVEAMRPHLERPVRWSAHLVSTEPWPF